MKPYRQKRYRQPKYRPGKDDVDTRSDSTRQGHHEGYIPYGAGLGPAGQGPLWLFENVGAGMNNPYLITGHAPAVGMRADVTNRIIAGTRKYAGNVDTKKLSPAYKEIEARYGDTYNPDDLEIWQKNAMPMIRRDAMQKYNGEYVLEDGNDFILMKNRKSIADARAYSEDGVLTPEMVYKSDPNEHHVTRRLYSGMIERQLQGGGKGLASGEYWVSGPATNKEILNFERTRLGNYGVHENTNLVPENAPTRVVNSEAEARAVNAKGHRYVYNNAPVYLLTKPAVNIPIKNRNVFDPRTLDVNGVHVPNFNSRSRFQAMLPFAIGGGLWAAEDNHNRGKDVPGYRGGRTPVTTGGAGVTSVYQQQPTSEDAQPTIDILERAANFMPYVGTILDWQLVVQGNLLKLPSTIIGTVADIFLPGLRSSYKAAKAYLAAYNAAPKIADKIKYYKASQKAYRNTATNAGYLAIGTWEDIIDDQQWAKPLYIK